VLVWPRGSGREVPVDTTLGDLGDGNQLTLEVRWPGAGGGWEEDEGALSSFLFPRHSLNCLQSSSALCELATLAN